VRSATSKLRAWTSWFLAERRRTRLAWRTPAVPVILSAVTQWDASVVGWADVQLTLAFNHGPWPVATLEVFCIIDGGEEGPVGTVVSTATAFTHGSVAQGESSLTYRARYRNGGVIGPVSAWFAHELALP
jgi:hypothetical protein